VGLPEKVTFGIGPLVAVPTATSTNFGPDSLQGGGAGVIIAPQSWGLLGVLVTYQHTLWGPSSQLITVQQERTWNDREKLGGLGKLAMSPKGNE
jgi:hypothetical protein